MFLLVKDTAFPASRGAVCSGIRRRSEETDGGEGSAGSRRTVLHLLYIGDNGRRLSGVTAGGASVCRTTGGNQRTAAKKSGKKMDSINGTSAEGGGLPSVTSAGRSAAATPRRGHSEGGGSGKNCIFFAKKSFFKVQKSNLIVVFVLFFSPLPTILSLKDAYIMYSNHRRTDL